MPKVVTWCVWVPKTCKHAHPFQSPLTIFNHVIPHTRIVNLPSTTLIVPSLKKKHWSPSRILKSQTIYISYGFPPFNIYALLISLMISSHQPKLMRFHVQHVHHEKKNHKLEPNAEGKTSQETRKQNDANAQLKSYINICSMLGLMFCYQPKSAQQDYLGQRLFQDRCDSSMIKVCLWWKCLCQVHNAHILRIKVHQMPQGFPSSLCYYHVRNGVSKVTTFWNSTKNSSHPWAFKVITRYSPPQNLHPPKK